MYLKKSFFDPGKLSRSARTCFALCALLLCSLFSTPALRAAASTSYPFNASYFTSRGVSSGYVQLSIPFYDDRGSDRYLQDGSYMEYYNGTSWIKFLEFDTDDEKEDDWYWVKVRKTSSSLPYIEGYADADGGWKEITTSWKSINVYRSNRNTQSPTFLKLNISMSNISSYFGSRPLAFRMYAVIDQNDQSANTYATWYLDNKTSPYQVWHAGGSMHKPSVTGYTINENGTVTVSANISSWNEWDDKGTVASSGYYNAKNVKIDNAYPQSEIKYSCTSSSSWGSVTTSARTRAYFNAAHTIYADNGRYDYQPAYSSILSESYSVPAYPCPSGLTATVTNGSVKLQWNMPAGTSASVADNYQIKYRKGTDAWQTVSVTKGYVYSETNPSVTFDFPETNEGTNSYEFLVARSKFAYDITDFNTVSSAVSINTNNVKATSLNATLNSDNSKVNITWKVDGGKFTSSYKYRLYRKQGANSWTQLREFAVTDAKSYTDDGLAVCDPYYYQLRIYDGSSEYSDISTAQAIVRPNTNIGSISDISVSKGYYNDRVNITWKATSGAGFKRYSITRRPLSNVNAPEQSLTEITANGLTQYSYEDHTATPGVYYEYKVNAWTECNGENNISQELYSTGFSQPFGVVSGKVSYAGDVAVRGVSIMATGESDYVNKSINFVATAKTAIETPCESSDLLSGAFSWQAYVMLNDAAGSANIQSLFDAAGKYAVEIDNNQVWLSVYKGNDSQYDEYHFTDITLERGVYYQLSVTYSVSGGTGTGILYVDGIPADTIVKTGVSAYTFPTASAADKKFCFGRYWETTGTEYFNGFMDEIRLWKKTLTAEDVAQNYDRYLSGKEEGLALYYRLDETSGDEIFDLSGRNGVYNENHGKLIGGDGTEKRSLNVPEPERLAIKAITDANGAYILNTIPYTGDGSMYTLTPVLGNHSFNPTNKPLYFNQQSPSYSNVNFTDVSSFQVRGQVVYEGGNYPVAGCSFEVDERPLTRPNGEVVKTDENGEFEITVPIGVHKVQVKKTGHTFANNGLLQANGADLDYNAPLANVKFSDQTRVKLIGRVVGGKIEDAKPLGFGEPVNNIGVQTIKLESTRQQYDFVSATAKASFGHNQGQWKTFNANGLEDDSTTVDYNGKDITIHVSPATGEFVAMVYPEPYIIDAISVPQGQGQPALDVYTRRESLDLTGYAYPDDSYLQTETRTWSDSAYIQNRPGVVDHYEYSEKSDTVRYNAKWTYYWQSTPTFSVTQLVNNQPVDYLGELETEIKGANGAESEVITLYDKATANYLFGKPVLQQGNRYAFRFNAYEAYTNYAGESPVTVTYPVTGGQVDLANNLQVDPQPETIDLDSTGVAVYTFMAGAPNLTDGYSDFFATLNLGAISYFWNLGQQPVEAWQLGEKSTGTNFMTSGPDQLTIILRDPPGSGSYAYIESGSSITSTSSTSIGGSMAEEAKLTTKLGAEVITFVGIGAGVITKTETKGDIVAGLSSEQTYSYDTESETTTTFTERFETSGEMDYVGAAGDVFIGNSTNLLYGLTNGVKVYRGEVTGSPYATQGDYKIAPSAAIAYGQEFATRFAFTTMELEDIMIPKWEQSIALRLQPVGTVPNTAGITAPVYVSKLQPDDANYGKWNLDEIFKSNPAFDRQKPYDGASYKIYFPSAWTQMGDEMKNFQDSILWARNQINTWIKVLAQNEKEKAEMQHKGNYSFGGGANIEYSEAASATSSYSHSFGFNLAPSLGTTIGGEVMGIGLEFEASVTLTVETSGSTGGSTETSKTTGFVLSEEGTTDEITVDYGLTESGTFAFKTRGGQTSCPYEGAVLSRYYEPGQHILSEATMQIEVPVINLSSASQVLNVPANRAATFTLAMQNESETGTDVWFRLVVDESTNPNGAELKIDGIGIGNGRMFSVPAGQTLTKTLTMNKGTVDDYENIGIILQSLCQPDEIADTAYISARFVPACSDVRIVQPSNNFILNTESATGKTLNVTLQDFDVNFPNFGYIRLEYRPVNSPNWNEITTFYPSALYANAQGTKEDIGDRASLTYGWDMPDADGQYDLRATTASVNIKNGNEIDGEPLSTFTTEAVTGYKDMKKPQALGLPSPANGILGAGDELSVTFNENINTGMLIRDNLSITYNGGTDVAFDFVASSNKITFDFPSDWFSVLERQNIEVEVKDVQDMHGNKCEPVTWSAYVHRNALVWDNEEISLIKEAGETLSFTAKIKNAGGSAVSYQVASLPWWLSVSSSVGNLQPLQSKELTFSISQGVNIGKYAENIGLTSGNDVVEQLPVNLNVTAIRPDWSVNPADFESTMTLTGQIRIEDAPQQDAADILGAFIGDECVGVVSPIYVEEYSDYFTFFTIYGNSAHVGQPITLKLWDAGTGNVYSSVVSTLSDAVQNLTFTANAMKGDAAIPVVHNALNIIEQSIALANGWNWISVNVTGDALLNQFKQRIGSAGELLKMQGSYTQSIEAPSWTGSLTSIEKEKMYIVKTNAATVLNFDGQAATPATSPISLVNGWNWIGYIPQFTLPTNEALAGLTAQVGDQIKGHSGYRIYTGAATGWIGSLNYLHTGKGYMYYSGASVDKSFNYPNVASQVYAPALRSASMPTENHWTTNVYKYPNTMTMTSVVVLNSEELQSDRIEIAAFAGEECRGSAMLQYEDNPLLNEHPYLGFLMVFGEGGETLTVKVYDHATGTEYVASSQVTFATDAINGTPLTPYQISVSVNTSVDDITLQAITLYPNPAETVLNVDYAADKLDWLRIADVTGRIVLSEPDFNKKSVNVGGWAKGVYLMSITVNGNTKVYRFIKE